jgi:hypothetical protein
MKKNTYPYLSIIIFLFASCLKAANPLADTPFTITDVAGSYKQGALKWEKGIIDSVNYKGVDDSASFSINNYFKDSIFISIITKAGINNKRYKLGLISKVDNPLGTVFQFANTITNPGYFLYKEAYLLTVSLYYPSAKKLAEANILNNSTKGVTDTVIYTEKVDFSAIKQ